MTGLSIFYVYPFNKLLHLNGACHSLPLRRVSFSHIFSKASNNLELKVVFNAIWAGASISTFKKLLMTQLCQ